MITENGEKVKGVACLRVWPAQPVGHSVLIGLLFGLCATGVAFLRPLPNNQQIGNEKRPFLTHHLVKCDELWAKRPFPPHHLAKFKVY
ncbi:MAG: hypothetical protein KC441_08625 [Anaerolineales bacterium]|nr:hypothetical protein [Anaerolineales bacterium]